MKPLLVRSPLYPDESLLSLMVRLAELNGYSTPFTIVRLCKDNLGQKDNLTQPANTETYQVLQDLLGIDADRLYQATSHRFAGIIISPLREKRYLTLPSGNKMQSLPPRNSRIVFYERNAQFCPQCIQEEPYHRITWMLSPTIACIKHKCLLTKKCPNCHNKVDIRGIVESCCQKCKFNLAETETPRLASDKLGLLTQEIIQSWWQLTPSNIVNAGIPEQPTIALFHIVRDLCRVAKSMQHSWHYRHNLSSEDCLVEPHIWKSHKKIVQRYCQYTTACKALLDWPHGFYKLLDAYRLRDGRNVEIPYIPDDLESVYKNCLEKNWRHPVFDFVQEAFNQYLRSNYAHTDTLRRVRRFREDPELQASFSYIAVSAAAKLLGISASKMTRLAKIHQLVGYKVPEIALPVPRRNLLIKRDDVLALRNRWQEAVSLEDAANLIGASRSGALSILRHGLLEQIRGPGVDGGGTWWVSYASIQDFINKLKQVASQKPKGKLIRINYAAQVLSVYKFSFAKIIDWVLRQKIKAYWEKEDEPLHRIKVSNADIQKLLTELREQQPWVTREKVAKERGVKIPTISRWVETGHLSPIKQTGRGMYFDPEDVDAFNSEYIGSRMAGRILCINILAVQKWARAGRLKPASGPDVDGAAHYLFRREDVIRLRPENRLSAPKMAERLGISRSQLGEWVRQGKIKPVSGPGVDDMKHYLFLLDSYLPNVFPKSEQN